MENKIKLALTYDDIQLVPSYSEIKSRKNINLHTSLSKNYKLLIPIVASPMDTVCEASMAIKIMEMGGVGCIHRFMSINEQCSEVQKIIEYKNEKKLDADWKHELNDTRIQIPIMAAVGVHSDDIIRAKALVNAGANVILIDVAHGHHRNVIDMIKTLKFDLPEYVDIIAGNIATKQAAIDLEEVGVDGLRAGIGGGCFTPDMEVRTSTGLKKIKDIQIGDEVYTHTGELKPVINKFEYDDYDEVYDIDGIEATYNHKFYVVHESKADLVDDDNIHKYAEWITADKLSDEYFLIELD